MGLRIHALDLIEAIKPYLPDNPVCYMIGTMDCRFNYRDLMKKYPETRNQIEGAGIKDLRQKCDLKTCFGVFGFKSVVTVDINDRADVYADLSQPIPEGHRGKADLICDVGTLEHIFDVKSGITNMNMFLKRDGIAFHMGVVSFFGHGFVNFNPSFFDSLYLGSGYKQIFRTMHVSIYNPFYIVNLEDIPKLARMFFLLTNKLLQKVSLIRFNLPLSRKGNNRVLSFFNGWIRHFGLPKNLMYCCAYQKLSDSLKIPYDVWE